MREPVTRIVRPLALAVIHDHHLRLTRAPGADGAAVALGALYGARGGSVWDVSVARAVELEARASTDGTTRVDLVAADAVDARRRRAGGEGGLVGFYRTTEGGGREAADAEAFDALRAWGRAIEGREDAEFVYLLVDVGVNGVGARWCERGVDGLEEREFATEARESERIAAEALATVATVGGGETRAGSFVLGLDSAAAVTRALRDRLAVVLEYVDGARSGAAETDHDALREIAAVMDILASGSNDTIRDGFEEEREDVLAVNYLASITKATDGLHELVEKFHVARGEHPSERGPRFFSRSRDRDRGSPLDAYPDFAGFDEAMLGV